MQDDSTHLAIAAADSPVGRAFIGHKQTVATLLHWVDPFAGLSDETTADMLRAAMSEAPDGGTATAERHLVAVSEEDRERIKRLANVGVPSAFARASEHMLASYTLLGVPPEEIDPNAVAAIAAAINVGSLISNVPTPREPSQEALADPS